MLSALQLCTIAPPELCTIAPMVRCSLWCALLLLLLSPSVQAPREEALDGLLGDELLDLVGDGETGIKRMVRLAYKIHGKTEGCDSIILGLASLFKVGATASHIERDFHAWANKQSWRKLLPKLYKFNITVLKKNGLGCKPMKHGVVLPHEVFGNLWREAPEIFQQTFKGRDGLLEYYWSNSSGTAWYQEHPVVAAVPDHNLRVPIALHGDDAGLHRREKMLVLSWFSACVRLPTIDNRIVFSSVPLANIIPDITLPEIYEVLAWSLEALSRICFRVAQTRLWLVFQIRSEFNAPKLNVGLCVSV